MDGFKGTKEDDMIKALSEMTPEVRRYIAEVTYAPSKNKQSRIELFTTDGLQVIGDISTISKKMKYYPQMSQSLSRDSSGKLKHEAILIYQSVLHLSHIVETRLLNQKAIKCD